ncbi:MAG: PAS domain S-box protein [Gammaproteobacteria bacterium]
MFGFVRGLAFLLGAAGAAAAAAVPASTVVSGESWIALSVCAAAVALGALVLAARLLRRMAAQVKAARREAADAQRRVSEAAAQRALLERAFAARGQDLEAASRSMMAGKRRFRDFVAAATDILWETDAEHRFVYLSDAAAQVLGASAGELIGEVCHYLQPPAAAPAADKWAEHLQAVAGHAPFHGFEIGFTRADGRPIWLSLSAVPYFDPSGAFAGYRGVGRDISRRRAAEVDRESTRMLHAVVFDTAQDGIVVADERGIILAANPAVQTVFGHAPQALIGRNVSMLAGAEHASRHDRYIADYLRTGVGRVAGGPGREVQALRADGTLLPVELRIASGRTAEGVRLVASIRDISVRKAAEAESAEARARAEHAARARTEFLANMSHELRTPLNAVIGLADLLLKSGIDARQREWLGKQRAAASGLLASVDDILDIAELETGRLALRPCAFDLDALLAPVVAEAGARAAAKGLELCHEPPASMPRLHGDPRRLRQVLAGLLGNAVKFTARGRVSLRAAVQAAEDGRARLAFTIADTGAGMDDATCMRAFEPFEQADGSHARRHGGTGLGLAIARRLARMMDGDVRIASTPGAGSTVEFTALLGVEHGADAGAAGTQSLRGLRVLLVDDNALNREIGTELLAGHGACVTSAGDGAEAVARATAPGADFDFVLMDVQMPLMDGYEATRRIRASARGRALPILAMTAHALPEDFERSRQAGMDAHLVKPFAIDALCAALGRLAPASRADARPALSPAVSSPQDAAPPYAALSPELARSAGIDLVAALRRMNGKTALYMKTLRGFLEQHAGAAGEIRAALDRGDAAAAARLAHTLKGVLGYVGSASCQGLAGELEAALRAGDPAAQELLRRFDDDLQALCAALAPAVSAAA